jgi:hypothetical protein
MSRSNHEFGGDWTEQKLDILDKYLGAYSAIFRKNEKAKFFKTIYVDAFAGTGVIEQSNAESEDDQAAKLLAGSASRAIRRSFDKYIFIEKAADRVSKLQELKKTSGVGNNIEIRRGDANAELLKLINETDWKKKFYLKSNQGELWGGETVTTSRTADWRAVKTFFVERLQSVFSKVHPKPAVLRNSNNTPLYLLCFAAANPVGAKTALKIADHLLKPFGN